MRRRAALRRDIRSPTSLSPVRFLIHRERLALGAWGADDERELHVPGAGGDMAARMVLLA